MGFRTTVYAAMTLCTVLCVPLPVREIRVGDRFDATLQETSRPFVLVITDSKDASVRSVPLSERVHEIRDLAAISDSLLLVQGRLEESASDIVTVVNVARAAILDTFWASRTVLAPNRRYVAYEYRYPPAGLPLLRNSVLLFCDPAAGCPQTGGRPRTPADKGIILYPEENRRERRYVIVPNSQASVRRFVSPIAWNSASTKLSVLESDAGETYLVVVDISKSPLLPTVTRQQLPKGPFIADYVGGRIPEEYAATPMVASGLRFVDGDTAVEIDSLPLGPFATKTAKIRIGESPVKPEPAPSESSEEFAIREGAAVQDAKVIRRVAPVYPPDARRNGIQGIVRFEAVINADGRVRELKAIGGPTELVSAAEAAVKHWEYKPTLLNGVRVPVRTIIEVPFALEQ